MFTFITMFQFYIQEHSCQLSQIFWSQTFTLSWQLISWHACLCPHTPFEVYVTFRWQYTTLTVSAPVVKGRLSSLQSLDAPVCLILLYKKAFKILFDFTVFVLDVYNLKDRENRTHVLKKTCNICNYLHVFIIFIKKEDTSNNNWLAFCSLHYS